MSFAGSSPSRVRAKIVCPREARRRRGDDNALVLVLGPEMEQRLAAARHVLARRVGETGLVVSLALVATYIATLPEHQGGDVGTGAAIFLTVLALLPLLPARRWPAFAAAASTLVTVASLREQDAPPGVASFAITLFLFVQLVTRRGLRFAAPLCVPFVVVTAARLDGRHSTLGSTTPLLFLLGALVVGESLRRRRVAVAALGETQDRMAESVRAQTVLEERARIARELHDIVAHHLSVIAVESEAARLTSPELSADAETRLQAIAATAREALTETRRLLGVLRDDSGSGADRAPQPGLDELDELIDKAEATGTPVRFVRQGRVVRLPRSVDLAAYRIVQEGLTNARRHAPGADVEVELSYRDGELRVRVRDHGPAAPGVELVPGHGLMGMRERAALAGGTFSAGPVEGGGFEVDVTLPTAETP